MSGTVTVLDNTADGTAALDAGGTLLTPNHPFGYVFTTDASSTWELRGLSLALSASASATYSIDFQIYATSAAKPVGGALASVSVSFVLTTTPGYFDVDTAALGGLASYSLAGGASYALVVFDYGASLTWNYLGTGSGTQPGGSFGFTFGNAVRGTDGGSVWNISADNPGFLMQAQATCFLRGTLILTSRGEVRVEALRAGDLVATRFGGLRPIRWIGTQGFEGRLAGKDHQPIRFARGSLGAGVPSCDLLVSPGHAMLVGDTLAHAGALVNGTTITQERVRGVIEYFHLDLGPHDCVLANGAWAESYFEDRNRDAFHNAADFHARFPGHEPVRQATCLPIVTAEIPLIEGLRARLAPAAMRWAA